MSGSACANQIRHEVDFDWTRAIFSCVKRLTLTAFILLALFASAVRLPASECVVGSAPIGKACKPACCASKTCCAESQKNHSLPSTPLAKDGGNHGLTAIVAMISTNFVVPFQSLHVVFPPPADVATLAPRLELLCTFLI